MEAKAQGKAESLKRLLTRKFGQLPQAIEAKVALATVEQLDAWFDGAIDAATLESVFCGH
jgi:hypothetical protein